MSWSTGPVTDEWGDWSWTFKTKAWLGTFVVKSKDRGKTWSEPIPVNVRPLKHGGCRLALRDNDELVSAVFTSGDDDILMVTRNGSGIRFSEQEVRSMGRDAAGVRGMRLRQGDELVSCDVVSEDRDVIIVTDAGYGKRTKSEHFHRQGRGGQGVRAIKLTAARGRVVAAFMAGLDDQILLVSSGGVVIRTGVREIAAQGRDATGVRLMSLDDGQSVAAAATLIASEDEEGEEG